MSNETSFDQTTRFVTATSGEQVNLDFYQKRHAPKLGQIGRVNSFEALITPFIYQFSSLLDSLNKFTSIHTKNDFYFLKQAVRECKELWLS